MLLQCCASLNSVFLGKSSFQAAFGSVELYGTGSLGGGGSYLSCQQFDPTEVGGNQSPIAICTFMNLWKRNIEQIY